MNLHHLGVVVAWGLVRPIAGLLEFNAKTPRRRDAKNFNHGWARVNTDGEMNHPPTYVAMSLVTNVRSE